MEFKDGLRKKSKREIIVFNISWNDKRIKIFDIDGNVKLWYITDNNGNTIS